MRTLEFVFKVLDPFLIANWGLYAIDFNEECGDHYDHIFDTLVAHDLRPALSPNAAEYWQSPHTFVLVTGLRLATRTGFAKQCGRRASQSILTGLSNNRLSALI